MHTPIPDQEIEIIKSLSLPFETVIDVGARADTDLVDIFPHANVHLFEVNPTFAQELAFKLEGNNRAFVNAYGLNDVDAELFYNDGTQSLDGSESWNGISDKKFQVKTLDWYVKENGITRIDFLKIDTEGNDFKVLLGGKEAIKMTRYIQYEHWNDKQEFIDLLSPDFFMEDVGFRNVLCTRKHGIAV